MRRTEKRKEIQFVKPRELTNTKGRFVEYSVQERTTIKLPSDKVIAGPWRTVAYDIRKIVG